ncbi:hypothetical protein NEOLEDRAFT_1142800 [Neolentinus lepideus HHB14362 ss-1]|uniref:Transmembrane protein 188 n=1 Tax=Neolentinus lepideus HHB14362 ss-1 TaxID=1314782 RepID=A0A165MWV5_9AGAM|nr:hypothetical protein NEOLEDRAFT_1142800 [Neolentinus lepideus HHB14362 ss-1]
MPARPPRSPAKQAFAPPTDPATYRDLLLFEERLKTNALILNRRKSRYQFFLVQLLAIIAFLLCEVLLQTDYLSVPYRYVLRAALPEVYAPDVRIHPAFASGLLFVASTTLALFFASGTYSEKIGYANRYVPHANKALRSFNMYLNVRQPPLRSKLPLYTLLSRFLSRSSSSSAPAPSTPPSPPTRTARSHSPSPSTTRRSPSMNPTIPSIPPSTNPRGELIFSSRVDKHFREGYERYRNSFEKKRGERERAAWERTWGGWVWSKLSRKGAGGERERVLSEAAVGGGKTSREGTPDTDAMGRGNRRGRKVG